MQQKMNFSNEGTWKDFLGLGEATYCGLVWLPGNLTVNTKQEV